MIVAYIVLSMSIQALYLYKIKKIFNLNVFFVCVYMFFYEFDYLYSFVFSMNNGFFLSGQYFLPAESAFENAAVYIFTVPLVWIGVAVFFAERKWEGEGYRREIGENKSTFLYLCYLYIVLSVLALLLLLYMITSTVGLIGYFSDLAQRSIIFESFTLQNALINFVMVSAAPVAAINYYVGIKRNRIASYFLIIVLVGLALLTGARAPLIQLAFFYLVVRHYCYRSVTLNLRLIFLFLILTGTLVQIAMSTRTVSVAHDNIVKNVFDTGQVPQSNNTLILIDDGLVGYLGGQSLINDSVAFIPRFLFETFGFEKRLGGNTYFTEYYWPERWENTKSQISVGGVNELLMNLGYLGALLFVFILSLVYNLYFKLRRQTGLCGLLIGFGLVWSIFQQLRGDYFHSVNKLFIYFCSIFFLFLLMRLFNKGKLQK